jgi:ribosome-interacting GTPase 1
MADKDRQFLPPFAELIDRLTVDQIKEVLLKTGKESYAEEMRWICNDIDLLIEERNIRNSSKLLRIVVILAQMNVHIWYLKDRMQENKERYDEYLKLAHQLNGIRNRMKNLLLEETGEREKSAERSNCSTDGLEGWDVSIS